tara:strand:+ start:111 stop:1277 length:1167 start_codon:yes stop_codon:yes gene_type:complete
MKFQVQRVNNSKGHLIYWKVVGYEGKQKITVKENGETVKFQPNQKRQANIYKDSLKPEEISLPGGRVKFENAFSDYFKYLKNDKLNQEESNHVKISLLKLHIQPYINKVWVNEYILADFLKYTLPRVNSSKKWVNRNKGTLIQLNKTIGKKTIKYAVAEFKLFLKYCKANKWHIDESILDFQFHKNFFQQVPKDYWIPQYANVVRLCNEEHDIKMKALYRLAAETGARPNEVVAICYNDVDFDKGLIHFRHSLDKKSNFRENFLKTDSSRRSVEVSDLCLNILKLHMQNQIFPKKEGLLKRVFNITKGRAYKKIKQSTKKLGIDWQEGFAVFRPFNSSLVRDMKILTDKQFQDRYGWTNLKTFGKFYQKDLNMNKTKRLAAINNLIKG